MTYVTINIETETLFPSFGSIKTDLRLIIVLYIILKHYYWGEGVLSNILDECLITFFKIRSTFSQEVKLISIFRFRYGYKSILYKAVLKPDPELQKKWTPDI